MPFSFAPLATSVVYAEESSEAVSLVDAAVYSGLGIGIVFLVLIILMVFIALMSAVLKGSADKPKAESTPKAEKAVAAAPVKKPVATAPAVAPDGAMFVTLDGKKHTVTVVEKIPQFTVKINGKTHSVDVEPVQEGEE